MQIEELVGIEQGVAEVGQGFAGGVDFDGGLGGGGFPAGGRAQVPAHLFAWHFCIFFNPNYDPTLASQLGNKGGGNSGEKKAKGK